MRCRTCDKTFYPSALKNKGTRELAEELHICGTCQWKIRQNKTKLSDDKMHVTTCMLCKKPCNRYSSIPTCSANKCRAKWYRLENDASLIRQCISKNDFTEIYSMTVRNVLELGFMFHVTELSNHPIQEMMMRRKKDD